MNYGPKGAMKMGRKSLNAPQGLSQEPGSRAMPEYLLLEEVITLLRFDATATNPRRACVHWLARHGVAVSRRGLVERSMLEAALREN